MVLLLNVILMDNILSSVIILSAILLSVTLMCSSCACLSPACRSVECHLVNSCFDLWYSSEGQPSVILLSGTVPNVAAPTQHVLGHKGGVICSQKKLEQATD
jgi:hypothetical protein